MSADDLPFIPLQVNTSQRLPLVLLLDGSGSMENSGAIVELNASLKVLAEELKKDLIAAQRVQLLVVRFGGDDEVDVLTEWVDAIDFTPPVLAANGRTPLGKATSVALAKLEEQKSRYRSMAIPYYRPWVFLITDGEPTDEAWSRAAAQCRAAEQEKKLLFFGIGVGADANLAKLSEFSSRAPVKLQGLKFRELFMWMGSSAGSASQSALGSTVQLAPPADWMEVPT